MVIPQPPELCSHDVGHGLRFLTGTLPPERVWDAEQFNEAWALHPPDKHRIMIHGRLVETPRWQQAYGADYEYTGNVNKALPVPSLLDPLHAWVRAAIDPRLNGLLLNWYDGPGHCIGPHHDSTKNMIPDAPIVTVSFGETRVFRLTHGPLGSAVRNFPAPNGTVFVMPWATNLAWKHSVPKSTRYTGRRISVTFRAFEPAAIDARVGNSS